MRQTSGYAIFRMPTDLVNAYDQRMRTHKAANLFLQLCDTLRPLPRAAYRGVARFPLMPLPSTDPDILRSFVQSGCDVKTEYAARRCFLEMLGPDTPPGDFDEALFPDYPAAAEVFSLLESLDQFEIIQVAREPFLDNVNGLGFDVGYWGGDHYSIICDSAVRPTWHPPHRDCFDELARELRAVNESFLFPSAEAATRFRTWYRPQSWAEIESQPDEFCIIQVNKPKGRGSQGSGYPGPFTGLAAQRS
jgi:hypothetical protein